MSTGWLAPLSSRRISSLSCHAIWKGNVYVRTGHVPNCDFLYITIKMKSFWNFPCVMVLGAAVSGLYKLLFTENRSPPQQIAHLAKCTMINSMRWSEKEFLISLRLHLNTVIITQTSSEYIWISLRLGANMELQQITCQQPMQPGEKNYPFTLLSWNKP